MKRKLLSILLALSLALSLLPTMAWADYQPSDPESWDTLTIKKADGANAEPNKDYTKVRTHDYNASNGGLYIFVYTIKTADPLTISGGGSYYYSSSRTEKAKVKIDSSVENANITLSGVTALASIEVSAGKSANFTLVGENYVDEILGGNATGTEATLTFGGTGSLTGGCVGGSSVLAPKIVINGGSYNLTGDWGAAIGGKSGVSVDGIIINDGELNLKCKAQWGAGIGGGQNGDAKNITINGGTVNAKSDWGAAIGAGQNGNAENIIINGGTVVAESYRGAAIGGGQGDKNSIAAKGTAKNIQIKDGNVTVISGGGAAIGAGQYANASDISITGGTVVVKNVSQSDNIKYYGTGIGAGAAFGEVNNAATNITISNANVTVLGNTYKTANKYKVMPVGTANGVTPIASNVSINCGVYMGKALDSSFIAEGYSAYTLSADTYIIGKADTVKVTDGKVVKGTFAFDITENEYVSDTSTVTEGDGVWKVTPPTVNIGGETETTAEVIVEQDFQVDMTGDSVAQEIKELDSTTQAAITNNTSVSGVNLTTEVATEAPAGTKSGLQAVVNAAVEANKELAAAIATAETVNIEVKVDVVPTEFKAPVAADQGVEEVIGTVTFELKPTATITVGSGGAEKSANVPVENSMIDQTKPITVSIYTGFKPVKIVHTGNDNFEEVFRKGDFEYDESKKVCTLTISHFSTLTAVAKVYVAEIDENHKYETLQDAVNAAGTDSLGTTITLLDDCTGGAIAIAENKFTEKGLTVDFAGHTYTVTAPAVGSSGTKNQAFQLLKGNTIVFKNGTIAIDASNLTAGTRISRVIQNYANLTLDNMKISDTNLAWRSESQTATGTLTSDTMVECDNGTVSLINGTTLTIADANKTSRYAFAMEDWPKGNYADGVQVTVDGATINGHVRFYSDGQRTGGDLKSTFTLKTNTLNGKIYDDAAGVTGGKITETIADRELLKESEKDGKAVYVLAPFVAQIGEKTYTTLAKAIAAVPTNGTKTTVTLLSDITAESDSAYVTINGGRNVDLDMNGHTIAISSCDAGPFVVNGGTLELSGTGTVKNTYEAKNEDDYDGFYIVKLVTAPENEKRANYSVFTQGKDVVLNGMDYVVNINKVGEQEYNYGAVANLNGKCTAKNTIVYVNGYIHNKEYAPIINFEPTAIIENKNYIAGYAVVNVADGAVFTSANNCFDIAAGELYINGGSFTGGNTIGHEASSGGSISTDTCCAVFVKQHTTRLPITINIKGGTFKSYVPFNQATGQADKDKPSNTPAPELVTLNISGGKFLSTATSDPTAVISADKTGFITGGLYSEKVDAAYIANGYVCIENPKDSTHEDYPYIVTVAPTKVEADAGAATVNKAGEKADTIDSKIDDNLAGKVKKDVVEKIVENASETSKSDIQEQITEEMVEVKDNATTKNVTLNESSRTRIDVKLESVQINVGTNEELPTNVTDCTVTTKTATYDVKPVVTVTTTNGGTGETEVETLVITNEWLKKNNKVLTFTLPVPESMAGDSVLVTHIKESGDTETFNARVETGANDNRFITIVAAEFSTYELSQQTEEGATAKIENGGKTYYYSSLANAVSDAQNNDTIILLKDSETGTITVDREVSFTLKLNGKALKANIVAGEKFELEQTFVNGGTKYEVLKQMGTTDGGGSGGVTTYTITGADTKNGKLTVDKKTAASGSTVTITVTPDKGFTLETLTVLDKNGKEIEVKNLGNNKFSFKMPRSKVSVEATFMEDNTMLNFFVDVKATDYFYDAVLWAAENSITKGVDAVHFGPEAPVTRGQVVTFLWRAAGKPVVNYAMNMSDMTSGEYYSEAVRWALAEGITKGTSDTTFSPDAVCTRGQIVTFLARFAGVEDTETESVFADVPASEFFAAAVKWAKDNGVTSGVTETTFEPYTNCNRAQVVTFLYRWMVK